MDSTYSASAFSHFTFLFFFFFPARVSALGDEVTVHHCLRAIHGTYHYFIQKKIIKNGSYSTIYTFKNYFATVFSAKWVISKRTLYIQLFKTSIFFLHLFFSNFFNVQVYCGTFSTKKVDKIFPNRRIKEPTHYNNMIVFSQSFWSYRIFSRLITPRIIVVKTQNLKLQGLSASLGQSKAHLINHALRTLSKEAQSTCRHTFLFYC